MRDLSELPLDSWVALYSAVKSRELERMAQMVTVLHSSDPQRLRQMLMNESKRMSVDKAAEWWRDPGKMREFARTLPGVSVREEKR